MRRTKIRFSRILIVLLIQNLGLQGYGSVASPIESPLYLTFQTRDKESGKISVKTKAINPKNTAVIVVDMWDRHWCETFTQRSAALIPDMNNALQSARALGMQVIFAPSDVVDAYDGKQQRSRIKEIRKGPIKQVNTFDPPALPWGKTGGCECGPDRQCQSDNVWTKQHDSLRIADMDLISDSGEEIGQYCLANHITTLLYMGVASNMCVTWTRPFAVLPMTRYGFECFVVRDLVTSIIGNGFDPDKNQVDADFTPEYGAAVTMEHIEKYICPTLSGNQLLIAAGSANRIGVGRKDVVRKFSKEFTSQYTPKGASTAFRQLCYDYNWVGRSLTDIPSKFTSADPVKYAELSKRANLDAALVLAVPHPGYTTYVSDYGTMFPGMQRDWFGEVVDELHKRDIKAIGYITLGTNWKYMRDHIGMDYIHSPMAEDGQIGHTGLCFNAPGYLDLVANYTTEVLTNYPVDAIRYDMLFTPKGCECEGCKAYYEEIYGEKFTDWGTVRSGNHADRYELFNLATMNRAASRMASVCKTVKPEIEVWQNHVNTDADADLNIGRLFDVAYTEFGSPYRLLALRGILDKKAIIVGQTLKSPIRRLIMALGARCYQYIPVEQKTALPVGGELKWVEEDLSQFYKMVADIQPYLEGATLPTDIGIVFSENTRYRFPGYSRRDYMNACETITNGYLEDSLPMQFINALDLQNRDLKRYRVLFMPRTSGLNDEQLAVIKRYVADGGNLVVLGDAMGHDEHGEALKQFALHKELGIEFGRSMEIKDSLEYGIKDLIFAKEGLGLRGSIPNSFTLKDLTKADVRDGKTLVWLNHGSERLPLVHVNSYGKGKMAFIASTGLNPLVKALVQASYGEQPISEKSGKQVVLAEQRELNRHVLHLIDDGDYEIRIQRGFSPISKIIAQYPASAGWDAVIVNDDEGCVIQVSGQSKDRLLVLE